MSTKTVFLVFEALLFVDLGRTSFNLSERAAIINGYRSPDRPFYVAINDIGNCGGSIISKTHVVTAAHCVEGMRSVNVIYGDFTGGRKYQTSGQVTIHEQYIPGTSDTPDIAIIRLSKSVPQSMVIPMCSKSYSRKPIAVCGMGTIVPGAAKTPVALVEVQLKETDCQPYVGSSSTKQVCLVGYNKDSCNGDSGGPAYPLSGKKASCLYGIVSFGSEHCEGWGVYTRISYYKNWIKSHM
ncbi:chymotrypsin-like isoform X2 [Convolutriloba macropyga]|uniref:chymotrypsin-like isoform X2 n=1 Tax=Convolutriloba macropyga TaxID=536237 RepID=UPI003F51BB93